MPDEKQSCPEDPVGVAAGLCTCDVMSKSLCPTHGPYETDYVKLEISLPTLTVFDEATMLKDDDSEIEDCGDPDCPECSVLFEKQPDGNWIETAQDEDGPSLTQLMFEAKQKLYGAEVMVQPAVFVDPDGAWQEAVDKAMAKKLSKATWKNPDVDIELNDLTTPVPQAAPLTKSEIAHLQSYGAPQKLVEKTKAAMKGKTVTVEVHAGKIDAAALAAAKKALMGGGMQPYDPAAHLWKGKPIEHLTPEEMNEYGAWKAVKFGAKKILVSPLMLAAMKAKGFDVSLYAVSPMMPTAEETPAWKRWVVRVLSAAARMGVIWAGVQGGQELTRPLGWPWWADTMLMLPVGVLAGMAAMLLVPWGVGKAGRGSWAEQIRESFEMVHSVAGKARDAWERWLARLPGVHPVFAWYDLWVGAYWDRKQKTLFVMLVPTLGFKIVFGDD